MLHSLADVRMYEMEKVYANSFILTPNKENSTHTIFFIFKFF